MNMHTASYMSVITYLHIKVLLWLLDSITTQSYLGSSNPYICEDMELPHTKGHTSNPWINCPKRGFLTTGGQIPIQKHYRSLYIFTKLVAFFSTQTHLFAMSLLKVIGYCQHLLAGYLFHSNTSARSNPKHLIDRIWHYYFTFKNGVLYRWHPSCLQYVFFCYSARYYSLAWHKSNYFHWRLGIYNTGHTAEQWQNEK